MELGSLFGDRDWSPSFVTAAQLASIITHLQRQTITSRSAKKLLLMKFEGDTRPTKDIIEEEDMTLRPLSSQEYLELAKGLLEEKPDMVKDIVDKRQVKKIKWFVGQMMLKSKEGSVEPDVAEDVLKKELGLR
jgi:aspartyl-tRNA(Asn)/glutamyl-tRNA(Gln) amidotransferase subunit B